MLGLPSPALLFLKPFTFNRSSRASETIWIPSLACKLLVGKAPTRSELSGWFTATAEFTHLISPPMRANVRLSLSACASRNDPVKH